MSDKNISWFQENMADKMLSDGATTFSAPIDCGSMASPYFIAYDIDSVADLSCVVPDTDDVANHIAVFERASDSTTYEAVASDWIGPRPVRRPHHP